jgi:phytoene dehydrogenase-like protein
MKNRDESKTIAIVGGGLAGLTAAAFAARAGHHVELFERAGEPGGRAATEEVSGFLFNRGAHALYRGFAGELALADLGVTYNGKLATQAGSAALRGGRKHVLPVGASGMLTTRLFGMRARLEATHFLAGLRGLDPAPFDTMTVREWLDGHLHQPAARDYVEALFRLSGYVNAPDLASAGAALRQLQGASGGVTYIDGGWRVLVDGLRAAAEAAGAIVHTGARVESVERAGDAVTGIRLADGGRSAADAVIIAGSPEGAAGLLEGGAGTVLAKWAEEAVPVRAATLDVGLSRLPNARTQFALGIDRPTYLSVHSRSARLAPDGCALVSAMIYLPAGVDADAGASLKEMEGVLDLVQRGWRDVLIERQFLPDMTVTNAVVRASWGGLGGRPGPAVPGIAGLFVAGDWVGQEGMLSDASFASGREAANLAGRSATPTAAPQSATTEFSTAR